ncbi:SGNH/GDSL hydrolase family protein [Ligilactobacillus agilis]|uniref:SGNH/GDSL hydrolase family protein n=1 Tax=Ligilactobacillus agilis TaxID=1601 RepID=A0A9Q9MW04_9LACO|nr:SGNH/GDSL hydrolase family protein [Ligilactobacillus agilis]UXC64369.1 SGNH/GDSL hydrolase family protein [Ligilactobacillus agilis]UXC66371.1 SGNH/GDSL hydrolase family protein [Ligilactobacillus agilis]
MTNYSNSRWKERGSFDKDILHSYQDIVDAIRTAPYGIDTREAMAQMLMFLYSTIQSIGDSFNIDMSPTDTFATLEKLREKYPNGQQGVFVVQDTGHWYFWSELDDLWKDGGVYQSVGISNDLQKIVDHGYKSNMVTINAKNYTVALPDLNDAEINSVYRLDFDAGTTELPYHVPIKQWPDYFNNAILIVTEQPHAQIMYIANDVFVRYVGRDYAWTDWYSVSGFNTGNITINSTDDLADLNNLMVGKMVSVSTAAAKTVANTPTDKKFNVITFASRIFGEYEHSQLAYDIYNNWYVRSQDSANNWSDWTKLSSELAIDAVREEYFSKYENQNVIWQRKNNKNVVMDTWIDDKNEVQKYNGWCYTNYYTPVRPNTNYLFIAKDSTNLNYQVVGLDSVYICLYDENGKFIKQIYTKTTSNGKFNTGEAYYLRWSMSYKQYNDQQYPSLIKGEVLPKILLPLTPSDYSDSTLLATAQSDYELVPTQNIYKMNSLPLYLYSDNLVRNSVENVQVYLYDNLSNTIKRNAMENGWVIPANQGNEVLQYNNEFYGIKGKSPNSYWHYDNDVFTKKTTIREYGLPDAYGDGQNVNVLIIGDSLTNANVYVDRVGELAAKDTHTTITLLGTRGETYKHEGRGGWSAAYYCTKTNFNTYDNPFLNQSGKFSFEYYAAKNNITKLDVVFINLGTNDVNYNDVTSDPEFAKDLEYYQQMIDSIKQTFPNVKIVLGSTITPARYKGANVHIKTRRQEWNDKILNLCLTKGYYYMPWWLVVDPINDFKYEEVQIDEYNAATIKKVADNTHPADSGYKKMGDLVYAMIKKVAEDIRTGK